MVIDGTCQGPRHREQFCEAAYLVEGSGHREWYSSNYPDHIGWKLLSPLGAVICDASIRSHLALIGIVASWERQMARRRVVLVLILALVGTSIPRVRVAGQGPTTIYLPIIARPPLRLAFVSTRDGNDEIYTMNGDGSGQTRLTNHPAFDTDPAWSPDGNRIAFSSYRDGNWTIYVMQADGSGLIRLLEPPFHDFEPVWSPDGARISFVSLRGETANPDIYVMQADGSELMRLTNHRAWDTEPAWSPDGTRIAFVSERDGNAEIYVVQADGSGQGRLTNSGALDEKPAWSPDGTRIAFVSNANIHVITLDSLVTIQLTNFPFDPQDSTSTPVWSPDSKQILFSHGPSVFPPAAPDTMYAIKADGSESQPRQLATDANGGVWSPDVTRIAFYTERYYTDGPPAQIKVMNIDGTQVITLTDQGENFYPTWAP